jgi:hypothetical protein
LYYLKTSYSTTVHKPLPPRHSARSPYPYGPSPYGPGITILLYGQHYTSIFIGIKRKKT